MEHLLNAKEIGIVASISNKVWNCCFILHSQIIVVVKSRDEGLSRADWTGLSCEAQTSLLRDCWCQWQKRRSTTWFNVATEEFIGEHFVVVAIISQCKVGIKKRLANRRSSRDHGANRTLMPRRVLYNRCWVRLWSTEWCENCACYMISLETRNTM